jgi:hypothetical protein
MIFLLDLYPLKNHSEDVLRAQNFQPSRSVILNLGREITFLGLRDMPKFLGGK